MGFQLSPGVEIKEFDFTNIIPQVASSAGAYAGPFTWGPADAITLVSSENELKSIFGKPTNTNAQGWFAAANFLAYGNNLKVVRTIESETAKNATDTGNAVLVKNDVDFDVKDENGNTQFQFAAKYPGALGNSIRVYVCEREAEHNITGTDIYTDAETALGTGNGVKFSQIFDRAPNITGSGVSFAGSAWANENSYSGNDEVNVVVVDYTGEISGIAFTVLEKFEGVSLYPGAKNPDGSSNYIRTVINNGSQWVWAGKDLTLSGTVIDDTNNAPGTAAFAPGDDKGYDLSSGTDGDACQANDFYSADGTRGYGLFLDPEQIDISLLILGAPDNASTDTHHTVVLQYLLDDIAEKRKDCVVFASAPYGGIFDQATSAEISTALINWRKLTFNRSSSYCVLDSGWKKQYDPYNDTFRWVPLNGDIAGLCARTDNERDPWYSPAGFNRGFVKRVVKLAFNPNKAQRDELYQSGINPVVSFPGQGTVLFGDKTALAKPSAFDRINVRRLFIVLEKAIATAARFQLFEFNDAFTRQSFIALVDPFLRDVSSRRGIYEFKVVCDSSNNTPEVIDSNRFVADIFIKPARSINFITLNFVATRTGVDFSEVAGGV